VGLGKKARGSDLTGLVQGSGFTSWFSVYVLGGEERLHGRLDFRLQGLF
jgi:hypothetical protein